MKISSRATSIWILILSVVMQFLACQDPPVSSLEKAKSAIKDAGRAGALRYAQSRYRSAENLQKAGWMEMARQKGRLAPFRNYRVADSLLVLAAKTAAEAALATRDTIRSLDSLSRLQRDELRKELLAWRDALDGSLENFKAERYWSAADLALLTSQQLIAEEEYEAAFQAIDKGRESLRSLEDAIAEYANDEVQKIRVWRQWVQETISDSRANGTYAVVIDKSAHKMYLMHGGDLIRSYKCELGYNSARQKLFSGDGATPEGKYRITKYKSNGDSKYHKALLLNYPNETDLQRFRLNKRRGIISSHARIGALIEIHGEGGRRRDWTEGCVALENESIDHLMEFVRVGTPVTIVRKSDRWP